MDKVSSPMFVLKCDIITINNIQKNYFMKTNNLTSLFMSVAMATGIGVVCGCTDNDYDLSSIDMTIGVGDGELLFPICSSDTIQLSDVLKLNDSESVIEKENGDYYFQEKGGDVEPARPYVEKITVLKKQGFLNDFTFSLENYIPRSAKGVSKAPININLSEEQLVYGFGYDGDYPDEVKKLITAEVECESSLDISFSKEVTAFIPVIDELTLELPEFLGIDNVTSSNSFKQSGSKITLTNVPTNKSAKVEFLINKIDFTKGQVKLGNIIAANGTLNLNAEILMGIKVSKIEISDLTADYNKCRISANMDMRNSIVITNVLGNFSPDMHLDDLGSVSVTGIPDFLSEDGVVIDLDNPQILFNIESDLDIPGYVNGTLIAQKDGQTTTRLQIPRIDILDNTTTKVCICRDASKVDGSMFTQVVEVPGLSTILNPIPDHLSFEADAHADSEKESNFELGKRYTLTPSYDIIAPLAFAENAKIVYTEVFDDFNKDVEDLDVKEGTYLVATADVVNKVPAYMNATAVAIDLNGNELPASVVAVDIEGEVGASTDGNSETVSQLKIKLTPAKGALKKLDGLKITISGTAKSDTGGATVTGQILNSKKHSLVIKNLKMKFVGTAIADLN